MKNFPLPSLYGASQTLKLPDARHVSLVGASGAGKSRFMDEMQRLAGDRALTVRAIDDSFPAVPMGLQARFADFIRSQALNDTPLFRRVRREWEDLFPGNVMMPGEEELFFKTSSGSDLIDLGRLSRGERAGLYYIASILSAKRNSVIFVDSPTLFLHPTVVTPLWNRLERLRPDCRFVYDTTDASFVGSRLQNIVIWVKAFHSETESWDYELLSATDAGKVFVDLIGSRRPVLFIEGDAEHSIDSRLYSLVFPDYTVRPLGSCDKVIETTRTFRYLKQYHPLDTLGIVDRDRRSEAEVSYLRRKSVMVAEVAEVENIFLSEPVVRIMASARGLDPEKTMRRVKDIVFDLFEDMFEAQALQHTRYQVKRDVERKIDARFTCITALELHIKGLIHTLHPRETYNQLLHDFAKLIRSRDYAGILKVFNHKPMLTATQIPHYLGFATSEEYVAGVLETLRTDPVNGPLLREAVKSLFTPPAGSRTNAVDESDSPVYSAARKNPHHRNKPDHKKRSVSSDRHISEPRDRKRRYKGNR